MALPDYKTEIAKIRELTAEAAALRRQLRWRKTKGSERDKTIRRLLDRMDSAMRPIRSGIGKARYGGVGAQTERTLRAVSESAQYERKQLKKMISS